MHRDLLALSQVHYDVLVVGGGVYGAATAWEAALRGLSVALIEKDDFCGATSANSLKTIHGGLRYLQHGDFKRMRESIRERTTLMRIAPHLVHPLPVLIPTYGHSFKGREAMALAMLVNDVVSIDRNLPDPQKRLPRGHTISRAECLRLLPGIPESGLTGGAVFYDAQAYNTERLVLAMLRSAAELGAQIANYVEADGFLREGSAVTGVAAHDHLTGERLDIRARVVINTAGPWAHRLMGWLNPTQPRTPLAQSINLVTRPLFDRYAVGLSAPRIYRDADALINKGSRLLFFSPWRGCSMIGTTADPYDGDADSFQVTEASVQRFLDDINQAYPPARLTLDDVTLVHGGLLPSPGVDAKSGDARIAKHALIYDHRQDGTDGLITVVGVKYTTARRVAQETLDRVFRRLGKTPPPSRSAVTPLHGGHIERFDGFVEQVIQEKSCGLDSGTLRRLALNYGTAYGRVLHYYDAADGSATAVLRAETRHAVREEMAYTLADVLLRRTDYGSAAHPGADAARACAEVMAAELGWTSTRVGQEIASLNAHYRLMRGSYAAVGAAPV